MGGLVQDRRIAAERCIKQFKQPIVDEGGELIHVWALFSLEENYAPNVLH